MIMKLILLLIPLKSKKKIACQAGNNGIKNVEIMIPSKYLSNFWSILEMPLMNF